MSLGNSPIVTTLVQGRLRAQISTILKALGCFLVIQVFVASSTAAELPKTMTLSPPANESDAASGTEQTPETATKSATTKQKDDSLAITEAPPVPQELEPPDVYFFNNQITPRFGSLANFSTYSNDKVLDYTLGVHYALPRDIDKQWELGGWIISRRLGGRLMARQKRYWESQKAFRPYYSLGAAVFTRLEDNVFFATRLANYQAISSIGFEKSLEGRMSWMAEAELGIGSEFRTLQLVIGYVWAW